MIRDRVKPGWYCHKCGGAHPSHQCEAGQTSDLPLETPSSNGPYRGTLPVREIPYGVSGTDGVKIILPKYRVRAGEVSRRLAIANSLKCGHCGKKVPKNARIHKYCSRLCQARAGYAKANEKRYKKRRTSKWG